MIVFEQTIPVLLVPGAAYRVPGTATNAYSARGTRHPAICPVIHLRRGVEAQRPDPQFKVMNVIDPFGNRIRFSEPV